MSGKVAYSESTGVRHTRKRLSASLRVEAVNFRADTNRDQKQQSTNDIRVLYRNIVKFSQFLLFKIAFFSGTTPLSSNKARSVSPLLLSGCLTSHKYLPE